MIAIGYTSAALLINYLHDIFPSYIENNLKYYLHEGKTHGLADVMEYIENEGFDLVICPDSSSNDYEYHKILKEKDITCIVLDHHEADHRSENAIVINNQLSDYPNKAMSGVGIVWQFCRYLDKILHKDFANFYIDLVALGMTADMMDIRSIETKHLIMKGFENENIHNPFIYEMFKKNSFSIGTYITPIGAAFYIVPFVNAMVRSGTLDEMEMLFSSMIKYKAFTQILSKKRGHKLGETARLVDEAIRIAVNVKSRQTKAQDTAVEKIENLIEINHMMEHKILLFLLNPNEIEPNIAGLIANKLMAKYQRPVLMLTKVEEKVDNIILTSNPPKPYYEVYYRGSARGYEKSGIESFKDICMQTGLVEYAEGHANAFGISIKESFIADFIKKTDELLKDVSSEPIYYVDYIYKGVDVDSTSILDIAELKDLWGQNMEESLICIEGLKVNKNMIQLMSKDKNPTLKITLPNKISLIKFKSSEEEYVNLCPEGFFEINIIGKCNANEWNGNITPQLIIEDYEITGISKWNF